MTLGIREMAFQDKDQWQQESSDLSHPICADELGPPQWHTIWVTTYVGYKVNRTGHKMGWGEEVETGTGVPPTCSHDFLVEGGKYIPQETGS